MRTYLNLVNNVISYGYRREGTRGGIDTLFLENKVLSFYMIDGFPMVTTKEVSWKNVLIENLWFLSGEKDVSFLRHYGCKFWDPWADKDGNVPSPYGFFWRNFPKYEDNFGGTFSGYVNYPVDQVKTALEKLKKNPNTRQAVITSWDPGNTKNSSLPPCHVMHVLNATKINGTDEYALSLHMMQRSCDLALGEPYNIAGYSLLLHIYAKILGMVPNKFNQHIVDAHIYTAGLDGSNAEYDHIPELKEQLKRTPLPLPTLTISDEVNSLEKLDIFIKRRPPLEEILEVFKLENYQHHPAIKFKAAV